MHWKKAIVMSEENPQLPATAPPAPNAPRPRRVRRRNWLPSLVWLIPLIAAIIGVTLAVKILSDRGPQITITFRSAEGLEAGKTRVKYKYSNRFIVVRRNGLPIKTK